MPRRVRPCCYAGSSRGCDEREGSNILRVSDAVDVDPSSYERPLAPSWREGFPMDGGGRCLRRRVSFYLQSIVPLPYRYSSIGHGLWLMCPSVKRDTHVSMYFIPYETKSELMRVCVLAFMKEHCRRVL